MQHSRQQRGSVALYDRKRQGGIQHPAAELDLRGWPLLGSLTVRASFWGPKRARNPSSS